MERNITVNQDKLEELAIKVENLGQLSEGIETHLDGLDPKNEINYKFRMGVIWALTNTIVDYAKILSDRMYGLIYESRNENKEGGG